MKPSLLLVLTVVFFNCKFEKEQTYHPPKIQGVSATDTYFGKVVTDPYRNLESLQDKNVLNWLVDQNKKTKTVLSKIKGRSKLISIQESLSNNSQDEITSVKFTNQ